VEGKQKNAFGERYLMDGAGPKGCAGPVVFYARAACLKKVSAMWRKTHRLTGRPTGKIPSKYTPKPRLT